MRCFDQGPICGIVHQHLQSSNLVNFFTPFKLTPYLGNVEKISFLLLQDTVGLCHQIRRHSRKLDRHQYMLSHIWNRKVKFDQIKSMSYGFHLKKQMSDQTGGMLMIQPLLTLVEWSTFIVWNLFIAVNLLTTPPELPFPDSWRGLNRDQHFVFFVTEMSEEAQTRRCVLDF